MNKTAIKKQKRERRHNRIRAEVTGTASRPRLAVFRSNRYMYAQLIDDENGTTLGGVDSRKITGDTLKERSQKTGTEIAALAKKIGVDTVVFDRGGFLYAGTVKALADGAREGGLTF